MTRDHGDAKNTTEFAMSSCGGILLSGLRERDKEDLLRGAEHTGELISLIKTSGGKARARANSYPLGHPTGAAGLIGLLHTLETMQIEFYLQAIPRLTPGPTRAAVATILTVDSQHVTMLRLAQGQTPVPSAFVTGRE